MKKYLLYFVFGLLTCTNTLAQKAGDVISGTVSDEIDVLAGAHVVELNKDNRVMASGVTDFNGNFSFAIRNPQDMLQITYIGCKTLTIPIKGLSYKIVMEADNHELQEVVISQKKRSETSGLDIPETEISTAMQSIKASDLENLAVATTVGEALQGRISGLDITWNSGNLGSGTSMRLRGVSSINGNTEPLIVVDGNVWESDANKDFDFANATDEKFAELLSVNPEDIETITVLKDAAATAIWGSQGANGVIEIKTKRGKRGPTRVSYSYRANMTYQPMGIKLLKGGEYTMFLKEAYFNPYLSDASSSIPEIMYLHSDAEYQDWRQFNNNTDWVDAVKQTGLEQKHFLTISGGGEKAHFRVSAGYDHQTGSIIEQRLDRFTERTSLDYFISDRIKVSTNFNFTYTNNHKNTGDLLGIAYKKMPNLAIYEELEDGVATDKFYHMKSTASSVFNGDQKTYANPIALAKEAKNDEKNFRIQPEFIIAYDLLGTSYEETRLKYDGRINFSIENRYNDTKYPSSLVTGGWADKNNNKVESDSYKSFAISTTHTLTYSPVFSNTDHNVMALVRFQLNNGTSRSQGDSKYGMPYGNISSTAAEGTIGGKFSTGASEWRSIYLTGSFHYGYKGKYMFDLSMRRDASSKFGKNTRWGTFPGISLRWNLSEEEWFKSKTEDWLSMLSIRPGWGIVGNQPGGENLFFIKYANTQGYMGHTAVKPNNIALNSLRWEQKETYNVGIDLGFLKQRITADLNLYKSITSDLLMNNYRIPSSSGFENLNIKNSGQMTNIGWEFNINTNRLVTFGKGWTVDFNVTFANNQNKLTQMEQSMLDIINTDFQYKNDAPYLTRVQLNNAFGSIYGFKYKGVYQYTKYTAEEVPGVSGPNAPVVRDEKGEVIMNEFGKPKPMYFNYGEGSSYEFKGGDAIYEDINHDGNIDELDIVYLGSSLPIITGGFGFKVQWGRLSWNTQFNFRYGNKIINGARRSAESMYNNDNQSRAVNWRWRVEGDITEIPRALRNYGYNSLPSDRFVEDGSFLRLNYSQISYTLDPKMLKKIGLNNVNVFISGSNIFKITKYSGADPEVGYGGYGVVTDNNRTPRPRSFSAGTTITF